MHDLIPYAASWLEYWKYIKALDTYYQAEIDRSIVPKPKLFRVSPLASTKQSVKGLVLKMSLERGFNLVPKPKKSLALEMIIH